MAMQKGARYVLVLRRQRDGSWWRKTGGQNPEWERLGIDLALAIEKAASEGGLLARLSD